MTVYLVGAGPGPSDLITERGGALLAAADAVVVDRLVDPALLARCRADAEIITVGKQSHDERSWRQEEINHLLVSLGRHHDVVVRLKGGDPYVFGRGAEEVDALREAGITCEVVPGVTSAFGVPALAGVAVTRREVSSSVLVLSGHDPAVVDWRWVAAAPGTVVVLMGVERRAEIARALQVGGRSPETPVAVVERGGAPEERRILTTLDSLALVEVSSPAVLVIGDVASSMDVASELAAALG